MPKILKGLVCAATCAMLSSSAVLMSGCAGLVTGTSNNTTPTTQSLVVSNVQTSAITTSGSQISWTTDAPADSSVDFGTTATFGNTTTVNSAMVTSHQVTLSGLAAGTTYYFQVNSTDSSGHHGHGGNSFKTVGFNVSGTISPTTAGSGATVTLSGPQTATTTPDSTGAYAFSGLPIGSYGVKPNKAGFNFSPASQTVAVTTADVTGVNFSASPSAVAPAITTQPASQTVTAGQMATFTVAATGTAPLTYQWQKNGANVSGATSSSYTTPATTTSDSGSTFNVVVSNSAGTVTSGSASLTVNAAVVAPTITTQPGNQTVTAGQTATFTVAATGTAPLTYQWQKNGTNIAGATSSSYTTPATATTDSGSTFDVVVSNSAGTKTSSAATLTVNAGPVAPTITTQPASQTVTAGQTATFSVVAGGTAPLSYQWQKNGANIAGATSSSYTTPATATTDSGSTFDVVASNSAGSTTSATVTLTVNAAAAAPTITTQPVGQTVTVGQTATFSVTASGTAPLSYQWKENGIDIPGATSASYTTPATTSGDNGSAFQVVVSNAAGNAPSNVVTLTVTSSSGPATAQLVQHVSSSNTRGGGSVNNTFSSPYCYHYQLPNPTTAGNSLIVSFTFNGNPIPSVIDDKGDSFTVQENFYDSADTQSIGIATAFNIASGARLISVCFSADPGGYTQPMATEFDNVIGLDGAASASMGSGTSVTAGALTPTVSGDLAYQVVFSLSANQSSFTAGSQSSISWNLLSADILDGWAAQYGSYNSTSPINPSLTMGTSQKWISAAVLLKTGASGNVPSGMRIVHLVHENIPYHASAGGTDIPFPNPTTVQFPSSGNLLVAMIGGGYLACTVTGVTDNNGNAWAQAGSTEIQANNDVTQAFYAASANASGSLRLTVNWSATDGDFTFFLYDVTGAATSPLDTTGGATGSQSNPGNLTMPYTITPAEAGELIFTEVIWDYNTGAGLVGAGWLFDTNTFDGEDQSGPEPIDQNNGWGHYWTTGIAPVSITWEPQYAGLATGNWSSVSIAFKPAP